MRILCVGGGGMFLRALRIQTLSNFEVSEPQNQNFIKQIHGRSSGCFVATQDSQGCSDISLKILIKQKKIKKLFDT